MEEIENEINSESDDEDKIVDEKEDDNELLLEAVNFFKKIEFNLKNNIFLNFIKAAFIKSGGKSMAPIPCKYGACKNYFFIFITSHYHYKRFKLKNFKFSLLSEKSSS